MQRWATSLKKILQYSPEFPWLTYLNFSVHLFYSSIDLLAVEQNLAEERRQKVTQYWMFNPCSCLPAPAPFSSSLYLTVGHLAVQKRRYLDRRG